MDKAESSRTYGDTIASGDARLHLGDVHNRYSYRYTLKNRKSDETLRESDRNKALLTTAAGGHTPRVRFLLELGADVEHSDERGLTALHHACLSGFDDTARALLDVGADINAMALDCGTALHLAALKARTSVVRLLLEYRAGVNAPSRLLGSPMHCSYYSGDDEIVRMLHSAGANGNTGAVVLPNLMESIFSEGKFITLPSSLPEWESMICPVNYWILHCLPYHLAVAKGNLNLLGRIPSRLSECYQALISFLTEGPLPALAFDHNRIHLASLAVQFNQPVALQNLCKNEVGLDPDDEFNAVVMAQAIVFGYAECLEAMVSFSKQYDLHPPTNRLSSEATLAVSIAVETGYTTCLEVLLPSAGPAFLDETLLMLVMQRDRMDIMECLLAHDKFHRPITGSAIKSDPEMFLPKLLHLGLDINKPSMYHNGGNLLLHAASRQDLEMVTALIKHEAMLDFQSRDGITALMVASYKGNIAIVSTLVDHGASLNLGDTRGLTAFLHAVINGQASVISFLLDRGATTDNWEDLCCNVIWLAVGLKNEEDRRRCVSILHDKLKENRAYAFYLDVFFRQAMYERNHDAVKLVWEENTLARQTGLISFRRWEIKRFLKNQPSNETLAAAADGTQNDAGDSSLTTEGSVKQAGRRGFFKKFRTPRA